VLLYMAFAIIGGIMWFLLATSGFSLTNQVLAQKSDAPTKIEPAKREPIEGSELIRLILSPRAAERLGIQTVPIGEEEVALERAALALADPASPTDPGSLMPATSAEGSSGTMQKVVPYSALLYDTHGNTWVYTSPKPLTFVRHQVEVDYIEGDVAVLSDGPATGISVVSIGAVELYGTEFGN